MNEIWKKHKGYKEAFVLPSKSSKASDFEGQGRFRLFEGKNKEIGFEGQSKGTSSFPFEAFEGFKTSKMENEGASKASKVRTKGGRASKTSKVKAKGFVLTFETPFVLVN